MNGSLDKRTPAKLPNKTQPNYRMKFGQTTEWSKISLQYTLQHFVMRRSRVVLFEKHNHIDGCVGDLLLLLTDWINQLIICKIELFCHFSKVKRG